MRRIGRPAGDRYLRIMTEAVLKSPKGPLQIHAPLQAWFESKAAEPAPEHLIALADELDALAATVVRKAS